MWNNSYRTPAESWQKTSDFQKGKLNFQKGSSREKAVRKQTKQTPWGGSCEGGKVSIHLETSSGAGTGGRYRTSETSTATSVCKTKQREFGKKSKLTSTSQPRSCLHTQMMSTGSFRGWTPGRGMGLTTVEIL